MGEGAPGTVWLVGMMGAGKSAVGRALAARLGREFVDTDLEVEKRAGRPVAAIFADQGEARFRSLEREAIEAVAGRPVVVALGGGAIAQPGMAERLAGSGTVVYLKARPETLLARVGADRSRPLLGTLGPEERLVRLKELLARRRVAYETASVAIATDDEDPVRVAERVAERLG